MNKIKSYDDFDSKEKTFVNHIIVAKNIRTLQKDDLIVVLDAENLQTTTALIEAKINPKNICVVELNPVTFQEQEKKNIWKVNHHLGNLKDILNKLHNEQKRIRGLYIDSMVSDPKSFYDEITLFYKNKALKKTKITYLWVTFCGRTNIKNNTIKNKINNLIDFIHSKNSSIEPKVIFPYRRNGNGTMMVHMYFSEVKNGNSECYWRPHTMKICKDNPELCRVKWWGYPNKSDQTIETKEDIDKLNSFFNLNFNSTVD